MFKKYNTIKNQLLLVFQFFTFILVFLSAISYFYLQKEEDIRLAKNWIDEVHLLTINLIKLDIDFLGSETVNPSFYATGRSNLLNYRKSAFSEIKTSLSALHKVEEIEDFNVGKELATLDSLIIRYDEVFRKISSKVLIRGYKNYGLIGKLRDFSRELDRFNYHVDLTDLFLFKDSEKEFYIRNEKIYAENFNKISQVLLIKLQTDPKKNDALIKLLGKYTTSFNELVVLENEIGLIDNRGLKAELDVLSSYIETEFDSVSTGAELTTTKLIDQLRTTFAFTALICIMLSVVLSYTFASRLTTPITKLSSYLNKVMSSNFHENIKLELDSTSREVKILTRSFNNMSDKIKEQFQMIEENSEKLKTRNNELKTINKKLHKSEKSLKELNQEKDKFFSIIAHDLKGPINSTTSFLTILANYSDSFSKEETKSMARDLLKSVNNLSTLLENLLEWARAQLGGLQFTPTDVQLKTITDSNVTLLTGIAEKKNITINSEIDSNVMIHADKNMLDFVIRNILSNAIKFTMKNGVINLSATQNSDGKTKVVISDNGIGMTKEQQEKLFKKGTYATREGTAQEKGTGLGLILCKEFIDKHKGEINVESIENKGTSFTFKLATSS